MIPLAREATHPGEVLAESFLRPLRIRVTQLAAHIGVERAVLTEVVRAQRPVTAELAWLLAQALATTPELWMNLQQRYDLARARPSVQRTALLCAATGAAGSRTRMGSTTPPGPKFFARSRKPVVTS